MNTSDYYPSGADTPDAPWNELPVPEKTFYVTVSQTLSKSGIPVVTNDYIPEVDINDGRSYEYQDTSDTNWIDAFNSNEHYTPLELIETFKEYLENSLQDLNTDSNDYKRAKKLISECENWVDDETDIIED